jgi:hypothetical protein
MWDLLGGELIEVPCTLDIEQTRESFHAYAVPEGIELNPGDTVLVHGAPDHIGFGEHLVRQSHATVHRAGMLARFWTRTTSMLELTELYEVGFAPKGDL